MIVLFAPHHPTQRLTLDIAKIVSHWERADAPVEFISLCSSLFNNIIKELFVKVALVLFGQAKPYNRTFAGWYSLTFIESVPSSALTPSTMWVDRATFPVNDVTVECVFDDYRKTPCQLLASLQSAEKG